MRTRWMASVLIGSVLLSGGCATRSFETEYQSGARQAQQGRYAEAADAFENALELSRKIPVEVDSLVRAMLELADLYLSHPELERDHRAEPLLREARQIAARYLPETSPLRLAVSRSRHERRSENIEQAAYGSGAARDRAHLQRLAAGSRHAFAHEQPRSRCG